MYNILEAVCCFWYYHKMGWKLMPFILQKLADYWSYLKLFKYALNCYSIVYKLLNIEGLKVELKRVIICKLFRNAIIFYVYWHNLGYSFNSLISENNLPNVYD